MISIRRGSLNCWRRQVIFAMFCYAVVTDDNVVEVNENDLNDHGINIDPTELDFLLPVVHSTLNPNETARFRQEKAVFNGRLNNKTSTSSKINHIRTSSEKAFPPEVKTTKLKGNFYGVGGTQKSHQNNGTSNKNTKRRNKKESGKTTGEVQLFNSHYNDYDTGRRKELTKQEKVKAKNKQEMLNNTLAGFGLQLDPHGQYIVLKDAKKQSATLKDRSSRNKKQDEDKGKKNIKTLNITREESSQEHDKRKNTNVDVIKSLWELMKNVSRKWK